MFRNLFKIKIMRTLFLVLTFLLITTATFAQRANNKWSNENVQTITGIIYDNSRPTSYMLSDNGTYYKVHLGPVWFWKQNNYSLLTGAVKIKGNVKTQGSELQLYPFTIEQNGSVITLADDNGVPKWGKNNGNQGKGNNWKDK
jgi:hypothetical protein